MADTEIETRLSSLEKDSSRQDQVPITYRILTFETDLPLPSQPTLTLEPPDLRHYVSPFKWSTSRKRSIMTVGYVVTILAAYSAGSYSPGLDQLSLKFGISPTAFETGITTYSLGFGIAPMLLAPISEMRGRYSVFVAKGILFLVSQLGCALTHSFPGLLIARFFVGVGASAGAALVGGLVTDLYHAEERNVPMAFFAASALLGTGLGPFCSGFIAQNLSWRWIFFVQVISSALMLLVVIFFLQESRGSVILEKKAKAINQWYDAREELGYFENRIPAEDGVIRNQRIRWRVESKRKENLGKFIGASIYKTFYLLFTEPVVFFFSLWIAFAWTVLFIAFSAIPLVFTTNHSFNVEQSGAVFAAICIGVILATLLSIFQDKLSLATKYGIRMKSAPEGRLYFSCIESMLLPIGLFWFAWTLFPDYNWIIPTIGIGCAAMGIYSIYLAVFHYLADVYHYHASSAIAAQSFCRSVLGGILPLATRPMFAYLSFAGACSLLGGVAAILTLVPWILVFYGPRIRKRSKFAQEIILEADTSP